MVRIEQLSVGFSTLSGIIGLGLAGLAVRAYQANRDPRMGFLTGAFTLFSLKSFVVAYALYSGVIEHQLLEFIDGVGDLGAVLLIIIPLFIRRDEE